MTMKTLEQIKNDYAISKTFKDWEDLLKYFMVENSKFYISNIIKHENEVMKIYAMECLKLASENFETVYYGNDVLHTATRNQITNENNIIK